jgi:hypothetical protein
VGDQDTLQILLLPLDKSLVELDPASEGSSIDFSKDVFNKKNTFLN